jgi:hypothetical protein
VWVTPPSLDDPHPPLLLLKKIRTIELDGKTIKLQIVSFHPSNSTVNLFAFLIPEDKCRSRVKTDWSFFCLFLGGSIAALPSRDAKMLGISRFV